MKTVSITDPQEVEAILRRCPYCMVGMVDAEGLPYVIPMNFAFEAGTVYLHSGPQGGKLDLVRRQPEVCLTFCEGHELVYMHRQVACSYSMKSRSIVCRGRVEFIDEMEEKRRILTLLMRQYTDEPCGFAEPAVRNVVIWKIPVRQLTCRSFGLRPSEIR